MKYRKKPLIIEAFKWTGGPDQQEDPEWMVDAIRKNIVSFVPSGMLIATLEGAMMASLGDYIIKGVKGEIYPCKPDIFMATYEPVIPPDPALVACPFCHVRHFVKVEYNMRHGYIVVCDVAAGGCGGSSSYCDHKEDAIKHWNSSSTPSESTYVNEPTDC